MSALVTALECLVKVTREATTHIKEASPFKASKPLPRHLEETAVGLSFAHLDAQTKAVCEMKEGEVGWMDSILTWLMEVASSLIKSVSVHGELLKEHQKVVDLKASEVSVAKTDINNLQVQVEKLQLECDEARQRGLKGNMLVSSPSLSNKASLLHPRRIKDAVTGVMRQETHLEACTRAIYAKTGIRVPAADVYACHPVPRRDVAPNTLFVICFSNRTSWSAWDMLANGLVSGKNGKGEMFKDVNVYISFQLTARRALLAKEVRQSLGSRGGVSRSKIDANGKISVKLTLDSHNWREVTGKDQLKGIIAADKASSPSHK